MIITIDFETAGFTAGVDEVLQVSINGYNPVTKDNEGRNTKC